MSNQKLIFGLSWGMLLAMPLLVLLVGSNYFQALNTELKPPGQNLFLFVKLSGLYAVCLLTAQITLALYGSAKSPSKKFGLTRRAHIFSGVLTVAIILLHVFSFLGAVYLRTGEFPWATLVPKFDHGYYKQRLGFGVLAMWLVLMTLTIGWLRVNFKSKIFSSLHKVSVLVFILAILHSLSIGSETRSFIGVAFYSIMVIAVLASLYKFNKNN